MFSFKLPIKNFVFWKTAHLFKKADKSLNEIYLRWHILIHTWNCVYEMWVLLTQIIIAFFIGEDKTFENFVQLIHVFSYTLMEHLISVKNTAATPVKDIDSWTTNHTVAIKACYLTCICYFWLVINLNCFDYASNFRYGYTMI